MKRCIERHEVVCKHYPRLCKKCLSFKEENNGDRIRSMSNEELANLLGDKCVCPPSGECAEASGNCDACWLKWLNKPTEDG